METQGIKFLGNICPTRTRKNPNAGRVYSPSGIAPCLSTMQGGNRQPMILIRSNTKLGYDIAELGDSINLEYPNSTTRRGRIGKQVAQTITTSPHQGAVVEAVSGGEVEEMSEPINPMPDGTCRTIKSQYYKTSKANFERSTTFGATGVKGGLAIRKLTPKECFRLMGFDDSDVDKLIAYGISNTQLYKMAGNSIVVTVLENLFKQIYKPVTPSIASKKQQSLDILNNI